MELKDLSNVPTKLLAIALELKSKFGVQKIAVERRMASREILVNLLTKRGNTVKVLIPYHVYEFEPDKIFDLIAKSFQRHNPRHGAAKPTTGIARIKRRGNLAWLSLR